MLLCPLSYCLSLKHIEFQSRKESFCSNFGLGYPWHSKSSNTVLSSMGTREINKREEQAEELLRAPVPSERKSDGNFR